MKNDIKVRFEKNEDAECIEVIVRAPERSGDVDRLMHLISGAPPELIVTEDKSGALIKLAPSDIVSVSVSGKTLQIATETERYTVRRPLHDFEKKLDASNFVGISRHEIINLDKVIKFDFTLGGTLRLELAGGMETWASRRNIPLIRKKLLNKEGDRDDS